MAENGEVDENETNEETAKDLRSQLKKAHSENKSLVDRLAELEAKDRSRTIADLVQATGLPSKVAKLLPADVEPTEDAIKAWVSEYEDVFKIGKADEETPSGDEGNADLGNSSDTREAHERLASATAGGAPGGKAADLLSKMQAAKTPEELNAILQSA